MKKLKTKHRIIICVCVILVLFAAFVIFKSCSENQMFYIRGDVTSVRVFNWFMKNPIETSDNEAIAVLLECLKKVKLNNKYWNPQIETAPIDYEISFNFSNGERKTYIYTVYPSEKYDNPFEEFFKLFPEAFPEG